MSNFVEGTAPAPAVPTGLAAGTPTSSTIPLTWNGVSGAGGYYVWKGGALVVDTPAGPSGKVADFAIENELLASTTDFGTGIGSYSLSLWYSAPDNTAAYRQLWYKGGQAEFMIDAYGNSIRVYLSRGYNGPAASLNMAALGIDPTGWHHVVATYDSATKITKTYHNGVLKATSDADTLPNNQGSSAMNIGGQYGPLAPFKTANYGIFSSALTLAEVESLYNSGIGKRYADLTTAEKISLISYWNMDETAGTRYDAHGANDLTDTNTVVGVTNSGAYTLTGLTGETAYSAQVSSHDANWQSEKCAAVTATTLSTLLDGLVAYWHLDGGTP